MATAAATTGSARTSGFLINVDRDEMSRWKQAAAAAGLTMAEYVRRAVRQADEAPTAAEIAAVRELTVQVNAAADRIAATLDRTIARVDELLDPAREQARRDEITADLEAAGTYLDLDALADAAR
jgi:methyl-accepting chemotaxis protein